MARGHGRPGRGAGRGQCADARPRSGQEGETMKLCRPADGRWERGIMDVSLVPRIAGALLFRPIPHRDERGFFCRTFDADVMRAAGLDPAAFVQHSLSRSALGVVRGLHGAAGTARRSWSDARSAQSSTSSWTYVPPRRHTATGRASNCVTTSRYALRARRLRAGLQALTDLRTFPIRSTAHTTRPRTSQSHSMIRIWPSRGHFPSPSRPSGTGRRRHSRLRPGSWSKPAPKLVI